MAAKKLLKEAGGRLLSFARDSAPSVKEGALAYIGKATNGSVPAASVPVAAGNGNPNAIALVANAYAAMGVPPTQSIGTDLIERMRALGLQNIVDSAQKAYADSLKVVDADSKLHGNLDTGQELMLKDIVKWAGVEFGYSAAAIKRHHTMLRLFLELDPPTLDHALALHI